MSTGQQPHGAFVLDDEYPGPFRIDNATNLETFLEEKNQEEEARLNSRDPYDSPISTHRSSSSAISQPESKNKIDPLDSLVDLLNKGTAAAFIKFEKILRDNILSLPSLLTRPCDQQNNSLLQIALHSESTFAFVREIIQRGGSIAINATNNQGKNALHTLVELRLSRATEIFELMRTQKGINFWQEDIHQQRPIAHTVASPLRKNLADEMRKPENSYEKEIFRHHQTTLQNYLKFSNIEGMLSLFKLYPFLMDSALVTIYEPWENDQKLADLHTSWEEFKIAIAGNDIDALTKYIDGDDILIPKDSKTPPQPRNHEGFLLREIAHKKREALLEKKQLTQYAHSVRKILLEDLKEDERLTKIYTTLTAATIAESKTIPETLFTTPSLLSKDRKGKPASKLHMLCHAIVNSPPKLSDKKSIRCVRELFSLIQTRSHIIDLITDDNFGRSLPLQKELSTTLTACTTPLALSLPLSNSHLLLHCIPLSTSYNNARTMIASRMKQLEIDFNAPDAKGYTALHHAAAQGNHPLISILFSSRANFSATTPEGHNALHLALKNGDKKCASELLKYCPALLNAQANTELDQQPIVQFALRECAENDELIEWVKGKISDAIYVEPAPRLLKKSQTHTSGLSGLSDADAYDIAFPHPPADSSPAPASSSALSQAAAFTALISPPYSSSSSHSNSAHSHLHGSW